MKSRRYVKAVCFVCIGLALAVCARSTWPQEASGAPDQQKTVRYTVTDLGTLGGTYSYAYGISNAGVVTGGAATATQTDGISQTAALWYGSSTPFNLGTLDGNECPACSSEAAAPDALGELAMISETAKPDPNGEDFCAFGTHRQCLAATWKSGVWTALPILNGGNNSQAYWINELGQVAGFAENGTLDSSCAAATPFQAFQFEGVIWDPDGEIRELLPLSGDTVSFALGINDLGQAVGVSGLCKNTSVPPISPSSGAPHGVLWEADGTPIYLGSLGGTFTVPASINDRGEVVGASQSSADGNIHPFLWTQEAGMLDLGEPAGAFVTAITCCHTINNKGQIVGFSLGADGPHAYLWEHGTMTDLNTVIPANSGWVLQFSSSISDRGQIVGYGVNGSGETHGFLLTPVGLAQPGARADVWRPRADGSKDR